MGAQATNVDTTAFGMLETLLASKLRTPLSEAAQQQPQLVAYHQRMQPVARFARLGLNMGQGALRP